MLDKVVSPGQRPGDLVGKAGFEPVRDGRGPRLPGLSAPFIGRREQSSAAKARQDYATLNRLVFTSSSAVCAVPGVTWNHSATTPAVTWPPSPTSAAIRRRSSAAGTSR